MAYASTRMPPVRRLIRRAAAFRARFGLRANLLEPLTWLDKPPRMWDRTFCRVLKVAQETEGRMRMALLASLDACTASLGELDGQIQSVPMPPR